MGGAQCAASMDRSTTTIICLCIVDTVTIDLTFSFFLLFFRKYIYEKKKKWLQICDCRECLNLNQCFWNVHSMCGNIEKNEHCTGIRVHRVARHANLITLHTYFYYLLTFYLWGKIFPCLRDLPFQQFRTISRGIIILPFFVSSPGIIYIRLFNFFSKVKKKKEGKEREEWERFVQTSKTWKTIKYILAIILGRERRMVDRVPAKLKRESPGVAPFSSIKKWHVGYYFRCKRIFSPADLCRIDVHLFQQPFRQQGKIRTADLYIEII